MNTNDPRRRGPLEKAHDFSPELQELFESPATENASWAHPSIFKSAAISEWKRPAEISRGTINMISTLGKGAFGVVMKAIVDDAPANGGRGRVRMPYLAAAKMFESPSEKELREIYLEASIMAQIEHPNIVRLVSSALRCLFA